MDTNTSSHRSTGWDWLLLLQTPAIALRGRVMLLAVVGVLAVWTFDAVIAETAPHNIELLASYRGVAEQASAHIASAWLAFVEPLGEVAQGKSLLVNALRCVWRIAVWGLIGGAIVRIAALSLTRDESPDVFGAFRFAWQNKSGFLGGPLLLVAGLGAVLLPLVVVRWAMGWTWLAPIAAIMWPVVILLAFVATVYTIAAVVGWPLIWAAAATDSSDAFDGVSRMFAYVYQKPLRFIGYIGVVLVIGCAAAIAANTFASSVLYAGSFAAGETASPWAEATIAWWQEAAISLVGVYLTAYVWTAAAGIYLLRRQDIDGVHIDEVFIAPDEFDAGLPQLAQDPTGVPSIEKNAPEAA